MKQKLLTILLVASLCALPLATTKLTQAQAPTSCANNSARSVHCAVGAGTAICGFTGPNNCPGYGAAATTNYFDCTPPGASSGTFCSNYTVDGVLAQAECARYFDCWIKFYTETLVDPVTGQIIFQYTYGVCEPNINNPVSAPSYSSLTSTFDCPT